MANIKLQYNNSASGQSIEIVYDDVLHTIVSGTVITYNPLLPNLLAGALRYYQPTSGTTYEVRVQNVSPFAYVVAVPNTCTVSVNSIVVDKADFPTSQNGKVTVNATTNQALFTYQLIGGPDNISITQFTNEFIALKPGVYQVKVTAANNLSFDVFCETALQTVVVGYNNIVCDLVLGTVNTTSAPGATLTIVNYTTSLAEPVEYRLDAGAWQNSNVFTGVSAGTKLVQIRFKNFPACTSSRNVTVGIVGCTLVVTSVQVVSESSKFGKNGALTILQANATGAVTYQIVGPSGTLSNSTGIFTGLRPGTYAISITDSIGCNAVAQAVVPAYKLPFFDVPIANTHRFVTLSGPVDINTVQDFDNRLLADMRFAFEKETCAFRQKINQTDNTQVQWRSSYSQHTIELRRQSDGALISTLVPVKRTSYTNRLVTKDCVITAGNTGFTQVYFTEGLPDFYQVGMDITLAGAGAMNGSYEIVDILPGVLLASGYQVLLLQTAYTLVPTTQVCTNSTVYNIEEWEVFEISINWSLYSINNYYLSIRGIDQQFADVIAQSEPVELQTAHDDTVLVQWWNNDNAFLIDYSTGIKMMMRVNARLSFPKPGGQITGMEDSVRRYIKLQENVTRLHDMEVWDTPFYLIEKLQIAMAHDNLYVNNVQYATEEKLEPQEFELEVLMNARARLRQVEFENENKTDDNSSTMSILSIDNAVIDCGGHNATGEVYPSVGGTGYGGAIKRGNWFIITTASAPDVNGDIKFPLGATLQALVDNPGQTDANWKMIRA